MCYWVKSVFYTYISQFTLQVDPHFKCFYMTQFYYPSAFSHFLNHLEVRKPVYCWNNECPELVHTMHHYYHLSGSWSIKSNSHTWRAAFYYLLKIITHCPLNKMCKWFCIKYNSSFRILCIFCKNSSLFEAECQLNVFR